MLCGANDKTFGYSACAGCIDGYTPFILFLDYEIAYITLVVKLDYTLIQLSHLYDINVKRCQLVVRLGYRVDMKYYASYSMPLFVVCKRMNNIVRMFFIRKWFIRK